MLLEPELLARLERVALTARGRVTGAYPGEHRSRRLGTSVDFADWRPYVPGDDFRRIDYQIYARLDRLLVRLYEAEDELTVRLMIDASTSMGFEGKLHAALRLAGALAYLAGIRGDRARVWIVDEDGLRAGPWVRSRDSAIALFSWLEGVSPKGSSSLLGGLGRLASAGATRAFTILLSDLFDEQWDAALRRLGGPEAEGALLHMLARSELDPLLRGDLLLVDSEATGSLEVSLSDQVVRQYRKRAAAWVRTVADSCRRRGVHYNLVHPDADLESLLLVELRKEGIVR
ncbi:MAG: DUF58 domain-containing protein [Actinomycetota bacterium]